MQFKKRLILSLVATALVASAAYSQMSLASEDVVKTREAGMKTMGKAMKTIKQLIESNGDKAQVAAEAQKIIDVSTKIPTWFPQASGPGEAGKPEIWAQWDKFEADAKNLHEQSSQLVAAAQGSGEAKALLTQFQNTGKACGTCHETFKKDN